jgi:hypothetical protein
MRLIAICGAMFPEIEGEVISIINGIVTFKDVNHPEDIYTTNAKDIRIWGEKTANGSPIGVYFHPEYTEILTG